MLEKIKTWCLKYCGGLVMEQKDGQWVISIGRVSFLTVLVVLLSLWLGVVEWKVDGKPSIPDGIMEAFYTLATYIFGSKVTGVLQTKYESKQDKNL